MRVADFEVSTPADRDYKLFNAIFLAQVKAELHGKDGILVTRHHFSRFSVDLTPAVPYGFIHFIHEFDQAHRGLEKEGRPRYYRTAFCAHPTRP